MSNYDEKIINCAEFEENLSAYLDKTLDRAQHKTMGAHALRCPLCHSLLNDVKGALQICHEIAVPKTALTPLEARILAMTTPDAALACHEFEDHLTDYLDGFLPASVFHRWERHAVLCEKCTNLPGEVVRSIAACYTARNEELPLPAGLHQRILRSTLGTTRAETVSASLPARFGEWIRSLNVPIGMPQLAPVAMMLLIALLTFSQTVAADNSIGSIYQKSFELAGQTYQQSAMLVLGEKPDENQPKSDQTPVQGTFINQEN